MFNKQQKTILVVDDQPDIILMMQDLLSDKYNLLTAGDGREALDIIEKENDRIELVIADIMMPKMDGMELLSEIKKSYPELGVIMITAYANIPITVKAMHQGAYDFIPKPLPGFDELDLTIARYFQKRQLEVEKRKLEEKIRQQELAEIERVYQELKDARNIQQSLLPKKQPKIEGFDIVGMSLPAKEVGGDFYDYLSMGENIGIVLADVCGKSMRAAMVAAMVNGMLHAGIKDRVDIWHSPGVILSELNISLASRLLDWMFTAMSLGVLKVKEKQLYFSNAGQPYPIVRQGEKAWQMELNGLPLGCLDEKICAELNEEYQSLNINLKKNDFVVFYSDGITEATDKNDEMYQTERLLDVVQKIDLGVSSQEMVDIIINDVAMFVGDVEQYDDMTIIVVRCK